MILYNNLQNVSMALEWFLSFRFVQKWNAVHFNCALFSFSNDYRSDCIIFHINILSCNHVKIVFVRACFFFFFLIFSLVHFANETYQLIKRNDPLLGVHCAVCFCTEISLKLNGNDWMATGSVRSQKKN